ncbi:MAG TPA: 16S rRNA (guanine(966)-N(2))-methyltransferase RsmD [Dehalococcoidia bacterium]|jgi:16S rRNA (guanine966-N2)-methyltransferase|nr:16S rRNA (guanine(966)-N(2))-methyltransferase RsmD [Dehalococcoidia bacterium]
MAGKTITIRVIAGSARGVALTGPRRADLRPTSGRLRESLFGMLDSADADMSAVIDLYAGTGALGIEALSRGAEHCTFVESDAATCRVITENLKRVRMEHQGEVVRAHVGRWRPPEDAAYTLVLADPPYAETATCWDEIEHSVEGALAPQTFLMVEHPAREHPPAALLGRSMWRDRRQGDGAVAFYRSQREEAA